ncbi:lytic transglycosylase domain-containing protein [Mesorhizobium sp. PUT5]|uniref:lytic transglycosylase domain-containing protein n=1 Tax=Mesorhizobium sp. PUT5 TaxID=3454629 RepID=UPI003FA470B9
MHIRPFVAAAFAAGTIAFALNTAQGAPLSPRADQGLAPVQAAKPLPAKAEKAASTKGKKHSPKRSARKAAPGRSKMRIDMTTTASVPPRAAKPAVAEKGAATQYSSIIARYAASYGVPVSLANAVVRIESNYRPNTVGSAGEIGLMQIKPSTARMLGYTGSAKGLFDPETNIKYGMKYLAMAQDLSDGTTCGTILKYNAGHAATRMNAVSSAYCRKVKVQLAALGAPA